MYLNNEKGGGGGGGGKNSDKQRWIQISNQLEITSYFFLNLFTNLLQSGKIFLRNRFINN